jgi:hypothetical protein
MFVDLIVVCVGGALIVMSAIAILNALTFARLKPLPPVPSPSRRGGISLV